jgi:hypothetical protein
MRYRNAQAFLKGLRTILDHRLPRSIPLIDLVVNAVDQCLLTEIAIKQRLGDVQLPGQLTGASENPQVAKCSMAFCTICFSRPLGKGAGLPL